MMNSHIKHLQTGAHSVWTGLALPTAKDENYRYFSVKNLVAHSEVDVNASIKEETLLVQAEGGEQLPHGAYFGSLSEALTSSLWGEKISKAAQNFSPAHKTDYFSMLIAARAQDGLCLYLPESVTIELPLRALLAMDAVHTTAVFSRFVVVLEKNAKATVVQELTSAQSGSDQVQAPAFMGVLNQFVLAQGAILNLSQIQTLDSATHLLLRSDVQQERDSELSMAVIHAGGGRVQSMFEGHLKGERAKAKIEGAVRGSGNDVYDFWATMRHTAPYTESILNYRAVMAGASKAVFNGNVVITPEAKGTVAEQRNRNMLLSDTAEVVSTPKLEIGCDDVKCAHGATVSSVSEDQLMYMQSRGISRTQAEEMIIQGFTEPVLELIPQESVRLRVSGLLEKKGQKMGQKV